MVRNKVKKICLILLIILIILAIGFLLFKFGFLESQTALDTTRGVSSLTGQGGAPAIPT